MCSAPVERSSDIAITLRARILRLSRSVLLSATGCGVLSVAATLVIDAWYRRTPHLTGVIQFALIIATVVALCGAFVQWPILRALRAADRRVVLASGALLGFVPFTMYVAVFTESNEAILELVRFSLRFPAEFLVSFVPMAFAGGVLAWFASSPAGRVP